MKIPTFGHLTGFIFGIAAIGYIQTKMSEYNDQEFPPNTIEVENATPAFSGTQITTGKRNITIRGNTNNIITSDPNTDCPEKGPLIIENGNNTLIFNGEVGAITSIEKDPETSNLDITIGTDGNVEVKGDNNAILVPC